MTYSTPMTSDVNGRQMVEYGATPRIVEHIQALIAGRETEAVPTNGPSVSAAGETRGDAMREAAQLAAGPSRENGLAEIPRADYWNRALSLCRLAAHGIDTDDVVVLALRRMMD